jgi:O-antigen biosynthesis protein
MTTNTPLVSIGVPIYNEEQYLRKTLESLNNQDYPNVEIIISDNASTDGTSQICQEFQYLNPNIVYSRAPVNCGAHLNGLSVLEKSRGKYFMFAAGHDLWDPTFISKAVQIMENDPDIILCYSKTIRIDTKDTPLEPGKNNWDLRDKPACSRLIYLVNNISGGDPCYGLVQLRHLRAFHELDFGFIWGQDQVMLAYYTLHGTIAHIPEPLFYLRMTDNEAVEERKKTVPLDYDPSKGHRMLTMSMTELWQQMGEATVEVINRSALPMAEKLTCKDEVRKCFTRRYGVRWNEIVPAQLQNEGKNILLATSAAPEQTPFSTGEKRPPIGVGFLISTLREAGHNVFFIDNYLSPSDFLETDYLQRHKIDVVGIYTNTICFRDSLRMFHRLEEMRQRGFWQGKIVAGGPHASVSPETIPSFVDHIVIGEGEYALRDIVAGTTTERVIHYPPIQDLDKLPMPAWDYFAELPYNWGGNWLPEAPVFTMNTSRGCPFSCTFCSVCSIWGKRYTSFSAERVVADIEHVVEKFGAKGIYFREDNFTLHRERLVRFCQLMIERNIGVPWVCESRVSNLDRDLIQLMARAGAVGFYFGVESGSQRLLDFMKKGITVEQIRAAFAWCNDFGIKTAASVIVGVPTETDQDLQETASLLREINPTVTWFNIFTGIPHSELLNFAYENNLVEFTDDRGLAYLNGHNRRVEMFYGTAWDAKVPVVLTEGTIAEPRVSVVMSVHNGEKHLKSAVESILTQSFLNYEFVIVDDGSTDTTPSILRSFTDPRIVVLTNRKNLGLTASLNRAIASARGTYIARMDADDLSAPDRFVRQVAFLDHHPNVAVVGSAYYTINDEDTVTGIIDVLTEPAEIRNGLPRQNWFGHGSVMMRRTCLEAVGGYDKRFRYAQDYDLFLRLSERFDLANIPAPLYSWRDSAAGISRSRQAEQQRFADLARNTAMSRRNAHSSSEATPMKDTPLVSVIVPTHNRPEMLATAIASILSQSMQSFEIIVVNDAGTDVTPVLRKFKRQENIRHIVHDSNRGLAAARNTGIRAARGKYIAYLDDDDTFYPNHLETLTGFLESNDYRVAYTDANRALQHKSGDGFVTVKREVIYSRDFNYDAILVDNFIPVLCVMHERSCLTQSGMFDESLPRHEDWDLWIRMSRHERFAHLPKVTCEFTYRPDGAGMTSSTLPMFLQTYKSVYRKHRELAAEKPVVKSMQLTSLFNVIYRIFQFIGERLEPYLANSGITDDMLAELTPSGAGLSQIKSSLLWRQAVSMDDTPSITYLEMALLADSENHPARIALCERFLRQGRHSDALEHFEFLVRANPNEPEFINTRDALAKLSGAAIPQTGSQKQNFDSVQTCNSSLDCFQQLETCLTSYEQLKNQLQSLHLDEAIRTIKNFLTETPDCAEAHNDLGVLYYRDGNKLQTLGHYEKAVRLCPLNSTFRKNLASFYFVEMEWTNEAIAIYTDILNSDSEDIDALTALGIISNTLNRKEEAGIFFRRVIELEPWNDEVRKELATLESTSTPRPEFLLPEPDDNAVKFTNNSEVDDILANQHKQPLSQEYSSDEEYRKVLKLADDGFTEQAIEELHQLLILDTDNALFHNDLAVLYSLTGNTENALFHQQKAVEIAPLNRNFLKNLAELYYRLANRIEDAIDIYTRLLKESPEDVDTLGALAIISNEIGQPEEAQTFLNKIIELDPDNMAARQLMEHIDFNSKNEFFVDGQTEYSIESNKEENELLIDPIVTVTIIIPVYNRLEFTKKCLESLSRNTPAGSYEIIIVDNGSTDGTTDFLQRQEITSKVISNQSNLGFSKACNQGAESAKGDYLVFLNNDTEPQPGWLDALVRIIHDDPAVGAVGSKLLYPDGTIQHAGVVLVDDRTVHDPLVGRHIYNGKPSNYPEANKPFCYQALTAAALLIRHSAFLKAGGFDENYWNGYEDLDLCFKLGALGYLLVYTPESVLIHHESKSGPERFSKAGQNICRLHEKWLNKIHPDFVITDQNTTITTGKGNIFPYNVTNLPLPANYSERIPLVSIVILTFNQLEKTKDCITSIRKHTPELHQIVFIDNGSNDGTVDWLHGLCEENQNYILIKNQHNKGFAAGCNQGIEASHGDFILLLNNDVIVTKYWLRGLLECLSLTSNGGIIGPRTNNISGIQQVTGARYDSVEELDVFAAAFRETNRHRRISYRRIVGFCMLFKRELVYKIGLLDESFGSGNFEDDDFCLRAELEGYRNVIAGDVFIHHVGSATFKGNNIDFSNAMTGNRKVFNDKWSRPVVGGSEALKILTLKTLEKAEIHYQRGESVKAIDTLLQEGISNASNEHRFYFALAEYFIDHERFKDAVDTLKELTESAENQRRNLLLGRALAGMGNLEEAEHLAKLTLRSDPSFAPTLTLSGRIAYDSGRQQEAISHFEAAITADPGYGEPYTCLGLIALQEDRREDAINLLEKGFLLSPLPTEAANHYHALITASGKFDRAEKLFREMHSFYPQHRRLHFLLIDILIRQEKYQQAIAEIEEACTVFGIEDGMLTAGLDLRQKIGPLSIEPKKKKAGTSVSLCMIVKNEEKNLPRCLLSLKPLVDEIIIIDTGSKDRSRIIAELFGARVFEHPWTGDFSTARNVSLEHATGNWILVMDADEVLAPKDHEQFRKLLKTSTSKKIAFSVTTRNYMIKMNAEHWQANDGHYPEQEVGCGWIPSNKVRLFTNLKTIRFTNPIHELVDQSLVTAGIPVSTSQIPVHHYGYLDKERLQEKGEQYYLLGKKKLTETGENDCTALSELAIQAGEIGRYGEAIELWNRVLELAPSLPLAYFNLGFVYLQLGKFSESREASAKAMALKKGYHEAVNNYAMAELCLGNLPEAVKVLKKTLAAKPDYPNAMAMLAVTSLYANKNEEGLKLFRKLSDNGVVFVEFINESVKKLTLAKRNDQASTILDSVIAAGYGNGETQELRQSLATGRYNFAN